MQLTLKFAAAAPPNGKVFRNLALSLTDAGGGVHAVSKSAAQITAEAVPQSDGTFTIAADFGAVAVGPYTVTAQSFEGGMGDPIGPSASGSGAVSLANGVWFPSPVAFV